MNKKKQIKKAKKSSKKIIIGVVILVLIFTTIPLFSLLNGKTQPSNPGNVPYQFVSQMNQISQFQTGILKNQIKK